MNFAEHYFERYKSLKPFFLDSPDPLLNIIVTIPCYDDEHIFRTLESLESAYPVNSKIEVIVNVNSGEQTSEGIVAKNKEIYNELKDKADTGYYKNFRLLPILVENTVKKRAGVGFARKTAMDEAVRRFDMVNKPEGLIVSLDADSLVSKKYFQVTEDIMLNNAASCFTFQFRHNFDTNHYSQQETDACRLYEMYLRYFRLALKSFGFPFAVHTIGSCFAIRAIDYIKLGGMTIRQGGEDFYFLQKAVKMAPVYEVKEELVYPSPRISHRVPFGTGPSVRNIIETGRYKVYNFKLFPLLKSFYALFPDMYTGDFKDKIPDKLLLFTGDKPFDDIINECRKYSSSLKSFTRRMYDKFDAFFIVKFLNSLNGSSDYPPVDVEAAAKELLSYYGINKITDLYRQITELDQK
jgi:hypothetical protein